MIILLPVGTAAISSDEPNTAPAELRETATNVTFVTTQGGSVNVYEHAGVLAAVHTPTHQRLWTHDKYRRYMDIDPLDADRVLVVAGERSGPDSFRRIAIVLNWRTGEELEKFEVPHDTHDVDYLGDGRYVVADKHNPTGGEKPRNGRVYVYNASTDKITWRYVFRNHYPPYPEAGGDQRGYTHLNDVDSIDNGTAFLVSPRDFDRVMSIDQQTKKTRWTLGEEDDYETLHEQHNPVLLQRDPLTVLVADSENNRIVEYQRASNGSWELTWSYSDGLRWPRDADRLPNGNTLIVDSNNDRVVEVTPNQEDVWEYNIERNPYDVERLQYGDEPTGPPMAEFQDQFDEPVQQNTNGNLLSNSVERLEASYNRLYQLVGVWVLPNFAGAGEFGFILFALVILVGWVGVEISVRLPIERIFRISVPDLDDRILASFGGAIMILSMSLLWVSIAEPSLTGIYSATSILLANIGYTYARLWVRNWDTVSVDRIDTVIRTGLVTVSCGIGGLLIYSQVAAGGRILLYSGLGIAVIATATRLFDS